jgi:hypothetical protein
MERSNEEVSKILTQLARKMGKNNASSLLSVLGRDRQFVNAIESPEGQELMKDAVSSVEDKISLILQEKDEPKDRSELKAYLNILSKWQGIINNYHKNKEKFDSALT